MTTGDDFSLGFGAGVAVSIFVALLWQGAMETWCPNGCVIRVEQIEETPNE